jgi:glycosyltransferase involved in cell wall biosynthesis
VLASRVLGSGRTEGTPTALVEAMSAGLPVVATDVGGVGALLTHERNGLLVPPGDPSALAAALAHLRDDAALRRRLARAGKKTAAQLTWQALAPHLDALVRET